MSLLSGKADSLLSGGPLTAGPPAPRPLPAMRSFSDPLATRKAIYDNVLDAAGGIEPLANDKHTLTLKDVGWADPERFSRRRRKEAVLTGETVARRLHGTWELTDNATGQVIDRRKQVVARVPYFSSMGTFTHRGNEYTVNNQQRLLPGVFARVKDNGELESHFNVMPGKGVSHRYFLDPEKGVFKLRVSQSEMPLMPLLKAMGTTDREFREHWGDALWQSNYAKNDASVLAKLKKKFLRPADVEGADEGTTNERLTAAFGRMELDPEVTRRTLGHPHTNVTKGAILAATGKLLRVSQGAEQPDDRDHLAYQSFHGPEDLFAERIRRDHGRHRQTLFRKISQAGSLARMPSGALTPQIEQIFSGSGLAQNIEEINPAEVLDKQSRITRMGEGGIPSYDSIPDEARAVQPSHMGFMDPLRTPESFAVGVDVHLARSARKGADGKIYTQLRNARTHREEWKSPQDLSDSAVATGEVFTSPFWQGMKRVPVMKGGKLEYVKKSDVDYVIPHFENAFSPLGNLIPLKSMVKGQRVAMGSRYLTQALPLLNPEAPLTQSGTPESGGQRSFEEEYGKHMGAVHAEQGGRVVGLKDGVLSLRHDDGSTKEVELYDHHPFSRKTYIHQTPLVGPGQPFVKGQPLVRSNYTDDKGTTALGVNARVAYMAWKGYNYEDAQVISESMARRMTSEHMYQHGLDVTDRHKVGKNAFVSFFPQKFDRATLGRLDERGVVKVGQQVEQGQPLILAARERDRAQNKVHKKGQAGYNDESVLWQHHDPGTVTDVVWGKNGPVVLVKSSSPMQVGDKMSGRYGDKGVVSKIVPDDQMPHDKDGKPFEVLLNPLGVISRTNPAQMVEAWLGKIARKTGRAVKVPDFADDRDMTEWARQQLQKHGLSDTEDVVDPEFGRKITAVPTGHRFFMKLHHTAESKSQGRGSGGYSMDETPSRGGAAGCFTGRTPLVIRDTLFPGGRPVVRGEANIEDVVTNRTACEVLTSDLNSTIEKFGRVTDWFHYRVPAGELVTLTLADGNTLECTRNHEFVLADGTRRMAGDLKPGDDLMEAPGHG
jgi:DNA-directed RNA polymerase beta subunit